jgi:FlaA1/EpsC-like NDP-sugar epimerase
VVYGTGGRSYWALHEMLEHPESRFRMIGFIDDNAADHRMRVHGYPVLGGYDVLVTLINAGNVDCVVVNSHFVRSDRARDVEQLCRQRGIQVFRFSVDLQQVVPADAVAQLERPTGTFV